MDDEREQDPGETGDIQAAKRELLHLGLTQGSLTRTQIEAMMPIEYMSKVELETLFFTFQTMNIQVIDE